MTTSYAITVVGHDRPGIIADVTGALAEHGGNLEDSTMSLLRGHFAWTLIVATDADESEIDTALEPLRHDHLMISVLELPPEQPEAQRETVSYWLSVHGADRPGIVSAITRVFANDGGNLTNLTTRLANGMYVVGADVDLPAEVDLLDITAKLNAAAKQLGVTANLRPADGDLL